MSLPKEYREICRMLLDATENGRVNWITQGATHIVQFQGFTLEIWAGTDEDGRDFVSFGLRDSKLNSFVDNWYVTDFERDDYSLMSSLFNAVRRKTGMVEQKLRDLEALLKSGDRVGFGPKDLLIITLARYGAGKVWNDVTNILRCRIVLGRIDDFPITNENLGGDPVPNVKKSLYIEYSYMGKPISVSYGEGQIISLPDDES